MAYFDFGSFIVGVVLGMFMMLLIIWIVYYTRSFVFTYCPITARVCGAADYYTNPQDALEAKMGLTGGQILWVKDGKLYYNKVVKHTDCVPGNDKVTYISYPQYCEFTTADGDTVLYKDTHYKSNIYQPAAYNTGPTITTSGDCHPIPGTFESGRPIAQWDGTVPLPSILY